MKKIGFTARLLLFEDRWLLRPLDKNAKVFVSRGDFMSFHKLFGEFKTGRTLKITVEEVKQK